MGQFPLKDGQNPLPHNAATRPNGNDGQANANVVYHRPSSTSHFSKQASTPDGAAFITKLLHPPSELRPLGIPDGADGNRVTVDQRTEITIDLAATSFITPTPPAVNTQEVDMLIWCPPGNNISAVVAIGLPGTDFRTAFLNNDTTKALLPGQVRVRAFYYEGTVLDGLIPTRGCCDSYTSDPGPPGPPRATGQQVHTQVGTPVYSIPIGEPAPAPAPASPPPTRLFGTSINQSRFTRYRTMASSVTAYFTAPATGDQGMWHVWTGASRLSRTRPFETYRKLGTADSGSQPSSTPPVTPYTDPSIYEAVAPTLFRVPFFEKEFARLRQNPYMARATEGFYAIMHPADVEFNFRERTSEYLSVDTVPNSYVSPYAWVRWGVTNNLVQNQPTVEGGSFPSMSPIATVPQNFTEQQLDTLANGYPLSTAFKATSAVPWLQSYFCVPNGTPFGTSYTLGLQYETDLAYDDWTHTVAIGRGFSTAATVTLKRCKCLEAELTSDSPLASQLARCPVRDQAALNAVLVLSRLAPTVYRARDNNFAKVLKDILGIVKKVAPVAAPVAAAIFPEAAPAILGIGDAIGAAASFGESALSATQKKRAPQPQPKRQKKKKPVAAAAKPNARIVVAAKKVGKGQTPRARNRAVLRDGKLLRIAI